MDNIDPAEEQQKRLIAFKKALKLIENDIYEGKDGKKNMLKNFVEFDDIEIHFSPDCPKKVQYLIEKIVKRFFVPPYKY